MLFSENTNIYIGRKISALFQQVKTEHVCIKRQSNEHQKSCNRSDTTIRYHMAKTHKQRSERFYFSNENSHVTRKPQDHTWNLMKTHGLVDYLWWSGFKTMKATWPDVYHLRTRPRSVHECPRDCLYANPLYAHTHTKPVPEKLEC